MSPTTHTDKSVQNEYYGSWRRFSEDVFQINAANEHGKALLRKQLRRGQVGQCFANLPPCLVGMAACASSHYWARRIRAFGHVVKLMAPRFVKPYVKSNKNAAADAAAIYEAVTRPSMRFVTIKTVEQQSVLSLHRVRQSFVRARTAQANQIRGLLGEFGLIVPQGIAYIAQRVPALLEEACNDLSVVFWRLIDRLLEHFRMLGQQVEEIESQIKEWHRANEASRRLEKVPGIGPITAGALMATVADAKNFENGRKLAAWLGVVPRQHSSGGKPTLLGMSKRGDAYLRTMLIPGARSVIYRATQKPETQNWVNNVVARGNKNVAAVALANKNARTVWALLAHNHDFQHGYASAAAAA